MYLAAYALIPWMNVLWLTISFGALGFPVVTSWAAVIDLGNEYSGSVSGWMNLWGNLGAFASPLLCGWLSRKYWLGSNFISKYCSLFFCYSTLVWCSSRSFANLIIYF